jgi:hypothetical protein
MLAFLLNKVSFQSKQHGAKAPLLRMNKMRKIEKQMMKAVFDRKSFDSSNTSVVYLPEDDRSQVFLHNHHIADFLHGERKVEVNVNTLRKWSTATTKSRLRAMCVNVYTKNYVTYLDDVAI